MQLSDLAERDKLVMLKAPFTGAPVEITRTEQRYAGLSWSENAGTALLSDYDVNRKWRRTWQLNVDDAKNSRRLVWDMSAVGNAQPGQDAAAASKGASMVTKMTRLYDSAKGKK